MICILPRTAVIALLLLGLTTPGTAQRQMENLTRGVVAVKQPDGVYVGWRLFGTDPENLAFNVYRATDGGAPSRINATPLTGATNTVDRDADPNASLAYFVRPVRQGQELAASEPVSAWDDNYLEIPIRPIARYR